VTSRRRARYAAWFLVCSITPRRRSIVTRYFDGSAFGANQLRDISPDADRGIVHAWKEIQLTSQVFLSRRMVLLLSPARMAKRVEKLLRVKHF
jgi:hypothetical protein